MAQIVQLLASPMHRFGGRPDDGPSQAPQGELVEQIRIQEGLGIVGDRYFGQPAHTEAAVTIIAHESLPAGAGLAQVRRNILIEGIAVDDLIGSVLVLDSGDGPVRLAVTSAAHPCAWMDVTIAPGAWRSLRGKGGVRCAALNDGILRVGPVEVTITGG